MNFGMKIKFENIIVKNLKFKTKHKIEINGF
jgi:pectate lyase